MEGWSVSTWWWVAAGVLVAAELGTGTFYLLMLATGTIAAALAAHAGLPFTGQLLAAAVVGGGATFGWHLRRSAQPPASPAGTNRDVNLDIGERVDVRSWDSDGGTHVHFRGARWAARFAGTGTPGPGLHVILGVEGNRLLLDRA